MFITKDSSLPLYFALVGKLRPQVGLCDVFLFRSSLWTAWLVALGFLVRAKHILFFFFYFSSLIWWLLKLAARERHVPQLEPT